MLRIAALRKGNDPSCMRQHAASYRRWHTPSRGHSAPPDNEPAAQNAPDALFEKRFVLCLPLAGAQGLQAGDQVLST